MMPEVYRPKKKRSKNGFTKTDSERLTHLAAEIKRLTAELTRPDKDNPRIRRK